jgi:hypothetical protein
MEGFSPNTPMMPSYDLNDSSTGYSNSNINYLNDEFRFSIGAKFHQTLPSITSIPTFSPTRINDWKDRLRSWLRSCHSLDYLIRDVRESHPIQTEDEDDEHYSKRVAIFKARDRAFFLVLDKSLSGASNIDPKFLALSDQLSLDESTAIGQKLYDGLMFLLKGSHLWSRIDTISSMVNLKLDKIGMEQKIFNDWKRESDLQQSLQLDLNKVQKLLLINALNHRKEHKTVMLQLAALSPEELFAMTPQAILERFLASAGHLNTKEGGEPLALLAEHGAPKRKLEGSTVTCFYCKQSGHYKSECPKFLKSKNKDVSGGKKKRSDSK